MRRLRCLWFGHRDQHLYPDGSVVCGRCGDDVPAGPLRGTVTFHLGVGVTPHGDDGLPTQEAEDHGTVAQ